ncbi:hypothetical protein BDA96_08G102800 [Sorghum bicolor]|uniref:Uncharacterized protein n=2 Tax=Sorghum bicolor TaxID=4558 RepID=A0A921QFW2_SORBI|nr:hypothetical protein BDA96_08G102800 [Sorghum bicolor]OQU79071.1 hypothetical protein SORBI_3008G091614 [Sorghum bicolor]
MYHSYCKIWMTPAVVKERNLEFEKEHANGGTMVNLHIKGTFAATVDISLLIRMSSNSCLCLTHYYVLSYLLVFSFSLTLGVFH